MHKVYILLGSNLGHSLDLLAAAREQLIQTVGPIEKTSSIYVTEAWGIEDQPPFHNQVVLLSTELHDPFDILDATQNIEQHLGRTNAARWTARTIDIDILYIDDLVLTSERLTIPHRYIPFRQFTLVPLCEIAENYIHPKLGKTNLELLHLSTDKLNVNFGENHRGFRSTEN